MPQLPLKTVTSVSKCLFFKIKVKQIRCIKVIQASFFLSRQPRIMWHFFQHLSFIHAAVMQRYFWGEQTLHLDISSGLLWTFTHLHLPGSVLIFESKFAYSRARAEDKKFSLKCNIKAIKQAFFTLSSEYRWKLLAMARSTSPREVDLNLFGSLKISLHEPI